MEELEKAKINMSLSGVRKIGVAYMKQKKAGVPVTEISVSRKRKKKCGRPTVLTADIARRMMAIQAENFDFNYCDLAFFNSLNTDVRIQSTSNRAQIIEAVKKCFAEYEAGRMAGCIRSLTSSYIGCLETGGDSTYKTHRGVAKNARNGVEDFAVAKSVMDKALRALAQLKAAEAAPAPAPAPGAAPTTTPTDQ